MASLTDRQRRFVDEYLIDLNATQAAIRAGYRKKTARQTAAENLSKPSIEVAISEAKQERAQRLQVDQDKVLADLEAIKQDAMQRVADRNGNQAMKSHNAALRACEIEARHLGMFEPAEPEDADQGVTFYDPDPDV